MQRGEQGPWRDRLRTVLIVAAVAVLALVALNPSGTRALVLGHGRGHSSDSAPAPPTGTPLPPETARPTAAPSAAEPDLPTVARPFAGSPALAWADGADGITLPHARHVGDVTTRQVADVLNTTKAYLIATNLDPAELRGGYPDAALHLADPVNGAPARMKAELRSPSAKNDPATWFTRYDPAQVKLVGTVIKVRGRMTFAQADHGAVRVHTDYSYVYAFTKARDSDGTVARVIVRREVDTQWYPGGAPGKVQIVKSVSSLGGSGCGYTDGNLHPFPFSASNTNPTGSITDPYDRSKPLSGVKQCGVVSRT